MGDWFGDWIGSWFGATESGGEGGGGEGGTNSSGLRTRRRPCPCCGGGTSGGGSGPRRVVCPNGDCVNLAVPETLVLSVNAIQLSTIMGGPFFDDMPRFIGDFTLTYLENEVMQRDVGDECEDANVSYGSGWFGDWIDCTDLIGSPDFFRYFYDACSGLLSLQYKTRDGLGCYLNVDWPPKEESYVRLPEPNLITLAITDCVDYFASVADPILTGSVAA